jgi:hypothetical protein
MSRIVVVGEDRLCCALGERLVSAALPEWTLALPAINTQGVTKLWSGIARYNQQAHVQPVLCIADADRQCVKSLLSNNAPSHSHPHFLLRLAVEEAESWLLADKGSFASFLAVPVNKIPDQPDTLSDPKQTILALSKRSRKRVLRDEMVSPFDNNKQGSGYNAHLTEFVRGHWNVDRAVQSSPSLARALPKIRSLNNLANESGR